MPNSEVVFAESDDSDIKMSIDIRDIPVREKVFRGFRRWAWTIRGGAKEVLFIDNISLRIREVTPDSFPRYTELTLFYNWASVCNEATLAAVVKYYARGANPGDWILLYERPFQAYDHSCGKGNIEFTQNWGSREFFDEIKGVSIEFPRSFEMSDPPCDE